MSEWKKLSTTLTPTDVRGTSQKKMYLLPMMASHTNHVPQQTNHFLYYIVVATHKPHNVLGYFEIDTIDSLLIFTNQLTCSSSFIIMRSFNSATNVIIVGSSDDTVLHFPKESDQLIPLDVTVVVFAVCREHPSMACILSFVSLLHNTFFCYWWCIATLITIIKIRYLLLSLWCFDSDVDV